MAQASSVKFTSLGAIIQELNVAGQNIVLGFAKKEHYEKYNAPWFGATIGRVANRIRDGKINSLNNQAYELETNDAPNALHGGSQGWGRRDFEGPFLVRRNGKDALLYTYRSEHLEAGYPGTVELRVFYTTDEEADGNVTRTVLSMEYEVELVGDECDETVINVTNHSYFNLSGDETVDGTSAKLATQNYLPLDKTGIPSGTIEAYPRGVTEPFTIGPNLPAFDDVFVMDRDVASIRLDTREQPLRLLAEFRHPGSHINLQVHSTEPAFQFYTGQGTDVPAVEGNPARKPFSGFCIEPSRFVNAINEPDWRHMVVLKKGEKYGSKVVYKAWKDAQ
ncbi:putative mutarotase [Aspergillus steynii IBT 23096]|uniref:Putative mutarotase n=1 Tax=Aspergillus steynii IBT 23096 TaxID=1392250 RepID=A0A2I2GFR8_9EURO|nr:putative mutarotase [Aspergillus steynii IBT 23096]PLB51726.1 putative mutarotase [Aspergillus steynii IBT 23096]